jgi:hypothetical protein
MGLSTGVLSVVGLVWFDYLRFRHLCLHYRNVEGTKAKAIRQADKPFRP